MREAVSSGRLGASEAAAAPQVQRDETPQPPSCATHFVRRGGGRDATSNAHARAASQMPGPEAEAQGVNGELLSEQVSEMREIMHTVPWLRNVIVAGDPAARPPWRGGQVGRRRRRFADRRGKMEVWRATQARAALQATSPLATAAGELALQSSGGAGNEDAALGRLRGLADGAGAHVAAVGRAARSGAGSGSDDESGGESDGSGGYDGSDGDTDDGDSDDEGDSDSEGSEDSVTSEEEVGARGAGAGAGGGQRAPARGAAVRRGR